jgi:hypothetical protein
MFATGQAWAWSLLLIVVFVASWGWIAAALPTLTELLRIGSTTVVVFSGIVLSVAWLIRYERKLRLRHEAWTSHAIDE